MTPKQSTNTFVKYRQSWRKGPQKPRQTQDDSPNKEQDEKEEPKHITDILDLYEATFTTNISMNEIPTEILLEIFGYLDYLTLHLSIRLACRRFNEIITDTRSEVLAEQLFRKIFDNATTSEHNKEYRGTIANSTVISMHPCISLLKISYPDKNPKSNLTIDNFGFYKASTLYDKTKYLKDFIPLSSTSLLQENALGPIITQDQAFREMKHRHIAVKPWIHGYGPASEGQTVYDFLKALIDRYNIHGDLMADIGKKKTDRPDCIGCLMGSIRGIPVHLGFLSVKDLYVHFVELHISKSGRRNIFCVVGFRHKHKYKREKGSAVRGVLQKALGWMNSSSSSSS